MGLTIHYDLTLPAKTPLADVFKRLQVLRQKALDLPFYEVGNLLTFSGDECDYNKREREDENRWLLIQAMGNVTFHKDADGKIKAGKNKNGHSYYGSVVPAKIVAFSAYPGQGCEQMNIGLVQLPKTMVVDNKGTRIKVPGGGAWSWNSFCKTQYAGAPDCGGLPNFLRCHMTVVALLDAAVDLGFEVDVRDEGHYWEKRDVADLSGGLKEWDEMIAGFGSMLEKSAQSVDKNLTVESAMDARSDRKELVAVGVETIRMKSPQVEAMLNKLVELTTKEKTHA